MTYMNKKITQVKNNSQINYTYITPSQIITTNKQITKDLDHKLH